MKDSLPEISVIMPVYEVELSWLRASIDSILGQTFKNFEFIIVYDCPKDKDILTTLNSYAEKYPRINLICNNKNLGIPHSLNKGIEIAKGKYIVRMDADDISIRNRLETQLAYMDNHPDVSLSGGQVIKINKDGQTLGESTNPTSAELLKKLARYINPTTHPTWIAKREVLVQIGMYRNMPNTEDYDLLLRLLSSGYLVTNVDDILILYRVHISSQSVAKANEQRICLNYARSLYIQRLKHGDDTYSLSDLTSLISTNELRKKNALDPVFLLKSKVPLTKIYGALMLMISVVSNRFERDYLICQTKAKSTKLVFGIMS